MNLRILAPAKINLGLEIGNKNPDGYHEVTMVMQSISLYDEIELSHSANPGINLTTDVDLNCEPQNNIAYRATTEFFHYANIKNEGINIKIKKNIPSCAGLAGGSTDGAGVIVGLNKMFAAHLNYEQMCEIGAKVGSDLPFCIMGGTAHAFGIGTQLNFLNPMPKCHIVAIKPDIAISTAKAYSDFDSIKTKKTHDLNPLISACQTQNLTEICKNLFNRFEQVINEPEIFKIKQELIRYGAINSLMTGSGSAVYGIFDDALKAQNCVVHLRKKYPNTFLAEPVNHGAKIT